MEGNNKDPHYPYSFPPPTWVDPYQPSSSSSSVPNWVIAAIVIAVVILVFLLFWYIRSREKKIKKKAAAKATTEKVKAAAEKAKAAKQDPPKKDPKAKPTPEEQIYIPNTCQSCGHAGGFYKFAYQCTWCKYKAEMGLSYPGPSGKK